MDEGIVLEIQKKSFGARNIAEKQEIIRKGRPTPVLNNKVKTQAFQKKWYEQIDWLCGSSITEKLNCWSCLLFKPKANQSWTGTGYSNFKNILTDCKHPSNSLNRLASYKNFKMFGQYDLISDISESTKLANQNHSKEVEENRQYSKQLTNAVLYLCKQGLFLHGHDKGTNSLNRGNYRELLHCFAEITNVFVLRLHGKEDSKQFLGVSVQFKMI